MAGHSKWANIQHRKARQDAKKSQAFARLIKEITIAARMGGGDPGMNPRLRLALDKASDLNLPKDNIKRAIDRGAGNIDSVNYEEVRYEGYGVGGSALIIDCLTDNKVRTVASVRHILGKYGGNLGISGSVIFQFTHCGLMVFSPGTDESLLFEKAIECGAQDILSNDDGSHEVITDPYKMFEIKERLISDGLVPAFSEVTMRANNEVSLSKEDSDKMQKLMDSLESLDDVQGLYCSASGF